MAAVNRTCFLIKRRDDELCLNAVGTDADTVDDPPLLTGMCFLCALLSSVHAESFAFCCETPTRLSKVMEKPSTQGRIPHPAT